MFCLLGFIYTHVIQFTNAVLLIVMELEGLNLFVSSMGYTLCHQCKGISRKFVRKLRIQEFFTHSKTFFDHLNFSV